VVKALEAPVPDPRIVLPIAGVAAVAAIVTGADIEIAVPVRSGVVHLPTIGTALMPASAETALVSVTASGFTVSSGTHSVAVSDRGHPGVAWRPARRVVLDAAGGLVVGIEDEDPYRDCHEWQVGGRLSRADHDAWTAALVEAWRHVRMDAPAYQTGLRAGLRVVTPLVPDPSGALRSATARHAIGAVGAALAPGPELAVMLVHEFQHSKLNALLDLCELVDGSYRSVLLPVGWRADPRPVEGVLQGIYAHAAVADMWRLRASRAAGGGDSAAREHFLRYRDWTATAAEDLIATGALTPAGSAFVGHLADTVATWPA
jgi:uncharacterized protein